MPTKAINFFLQDVNIDLKNRNKIREWLKNVADSEKCKISNLNYIFCTDSYLLGINQNFLNHNTLTDVISFDYSVRKDELQGEIYISTERVKDNSKEYNVIFIEELKRVMVHGLLHLIGYEDDSEDKKKIMREKEDYYLYLYKKIL